ncbi:MAG: hypothetical protein C4539_02815 [Ignavibacteriales bacterium]|nr:MAG: hypothetical protein C4539_02815 [Ignavibacteriales bacterium]
MNKSHYRITTCLILLFIFTSLLYAGEDSKSKEDSVNWKISLNNLHLDFIPFLVVNNGSLFSDIEFFKFKNIHLQTRVGLGVTYFFHMALADGGGEVDGSPFADIDALLLFGSQRDKRLIFEFYAGYSYRINLKSNTDNYPAHLFKYGFEIDWMFWRQFMGLQLKACLTKSKNGIEEDIFGLGFTFCLPSKYL